MLAHDIENIKHEPSKSHKSLHVIVPKFFSIYSVTPRRVLLLMSHGFGGLAPIRPPFLCRFSASPSPIDRLCLLRIGGDMFFLHVVKEVESMSQ